MECPKTASIRVTNQPKPAITTIRIGSQPVSIDLVNTSSQNYHRDQDIRQQLDSLKQSRLTLNSRQSEGINIRSGTGEAAVAKERQIANARAEGNRMQISASNQNVLNSMQQHLSQHSNNAVSTVNRLNSQQ